MGEATATTTATATAEIFRLCDFNDRNNDGIISKKNSWWKPQEGYQFDADLDNDREIDLLEAKFYLTTLDVPHRQRALYALTPEEEASLLKSFSRRLAFRYGEAFLDAQKYDYFLKTPERMLISGAEFLKSGALEYLELADGAHQQRAQEIKQLAYFSDTYEEARQLFQTSLEAVRPQHTGLISTSFQLPETSDLFVDLAYLPATQSQDRLLVMISGTHGVEGFYGSAAQTWLLDQIHQKKVTLDHTGIIFVHAYNPWGFKNELRFMEGNVDGNRNNRINNDFAPDASAAYVKLNGMINPPQLFSHDASWRRSFPLKSFVRLFYYGHGNLDRGRAMIRQAVMEGQTEFPKGVSYAGETYAPQLEPVTEFFQEHSEGYQEIIVMDVHTGLGEPGKVNWLSIDPEISEAEQTQLNELFGSVKYTKDDNENFYTLQGDIMGYLCSQAGKDQTCLRIAPEAGTLGIGTRAQMQSMKTLIGMCQFGREGAETEEDERIIKTEVLQFLNPRNPDWRETVMAQMEERVLPLFRSE